jgi:deazaflavin-dependent oxidoreductase (nitroreductase family)
MRDGAVKRWSAVHRSLYQMSGGRIGRRLADNDMLLLTTTGHVSRRPHTVPLLYIRDEPRLLVVASYGGRPRHPAWYDNLVADPLVRVQLGAMRVEMVARTAEPDERAVWWPRVVAAFADYAVYQSRTDRVIPLVFLEPTPSVN